MFRLALCAAFLLDVVNIGAVIQVTGASALQRGALSFAAIIGLFTRRVDVVCLSLLGLVFVELVSLGMITDFPMFEWGTLIGALNQVFLVYALLSIRVTKIDAVAVLTFIAFMPLLSVVLGIIYDAAGIYTFSSREFATGLMRFRGSVVTPAYLSALGMCGTYAALQLALWGKRNMYLFAMINLAVLLAAGGRATLAATIIVCFASIVLARNVQILSKVGILMAGFAAALAIAAAFWDRIIARFGESGDNGRAAIWDYLNELARQYPTAGIGFGHQYPVTPESIAKMFGSAAAHSDYVRFNLELGEFGFPLFYVLLTLLVVKAALRSGSLLRSQVLWAYLAILLLSRTDNVFTSPIEIGLLFFAVLADELAKKSQPAGAVPHRPVAEAPKVDRWARNFGAIDAKPAGRVTGA